MSMPWIPVLQKAMRILTILLFLISSDKMNALDDMSCNINNATSIMLPNLDLYFKDSGNQECHKMTS